MALKRDSFKPKPEEDNINYCGGNGQMLMSDPDGIFHNCTRYSSSSLGDERPALIIGNCNDGIGITDLEKNNIKMMQEITRRSQSTDECFYCPIASGCPWCSAYNYQRFGTPNKRTVTTCNLHKAEALISSYYWNRYYQANNLDEKYKLSFDYNFIEGIISKEEYNLLKKMEGE
jgi:radical SAM protein with 4Fe4S-binding SPASM domain